MSVVSHADKPNMEPGSISLGVNQGKPCVEGQENTPNTQGLKGIAVPLVICGALNSTKAGVEAFSPEGILQGGAFSHDGVKKGYAKIAQFKNKAQNAQITNMATTTMHTAQQTAQHQEKQCTITNGILTDCNSAQSAFNFSTENILQNIGLFHKPGTSHTAQYSFNLPTSQPISPLAWHSSSASNQITNNESNLSVGENVVLEIPLKKSGKNIEIAINSVLTFISKCINDQLKLDQIVKLLCNYYHGKDLKQAYEFCRSLLEKKDKPKRRNANYESSGNIKIVSMCKKIVKLVKLLKKIKKHYVSVPKSECSSNLYKTK